MSHTWPGRAPGCWPSMRSRAQRTGLNGFRYGRDHRAQLLGRSGLSPFQSSPRSISGKTAFSRGRVKISASTASGTSAGQNSRSRADAGGVRHTSDPRPGAALPGRRQTLPSSFSRPAENPLQVVTVHRAIVLHPPGQQVAGDVQQRVQGRECVASLLCPRMKASGVNQDKAQFVAESADVPKVWPRMICRYSCRTVASGSAMS